MTFRDELLPCPNCQAGLASRGQRLVCDACMGLLVTTVELVSLVREITPERVSSMQQVREVRRGSLSCPRCTTQMTVVAMLGMQVDRCAAHGLWFEGGGLEKLLGGGPDAIAAFHEDCQDRQGRVRRRSLGSMLRGLLRFRWQK